MTLAEISAELRLLAGELRGHDDLDQWIRLDALAGEIDKERNFLTKRCNALAERCLAAEAERDRLAAEVTDERTGRHMAEDERQHLKGKWSA